MGAIFSREQSSRTVDPAISEVWGSWFSDSAGAVICLSDPLTAVVKQFPFTLPLEPPRNPPRIAVTPEQSELFRRFFELQPGGHLYLSPAFSQSKMGEALGTATLTAKLTRAGLPVHATPKAVFYVGTASAIRISLVGHDEASRWLGPILNRLPVRMVTTEAGKARQIAVSVPGGQASRIFSGIPAEARAIPAITHSSPCSLAQTKGHQLLLLNGPNTEGTQIAMDYLCDPKRLRELLTQIHASAPAHKGPWHFQFILRTEVRDQVPIRAELLVVKVL